MTNKTVHISHPIRRCLRDKRLKATPYTATLYHVFVFGEGEVESSLFSFFFFSIYSVQGWRRFLIRYFIISQWITQPSRWTCKAWAEFLIPNFIVGFQIIVSIIRDWVSKLGPEFKIIPEALSFPVCSDGNMHPTINRVCTDRQKRKLCGKKTF